MMKLTCLKKERDANNSIIGYIVRNIDTGVVFRLQPSVLKKDIIAKEVYIDNLKLTSDYRLIDYDNGNDTINKYIESCKTLGIKPLTIEFVNNLYIIKDLPDGESNIVIPDFVDAIVMQKKLVRVNKVNTPDSSSNKYLDDKKVEEYLLKIGTKLDKIDRKTTIIINKLDSAESKVEQVVDKLDKFKGIGVVDSLIDYTKENGKAAIESAEKVRPILNNVIDTMITDDNAFKFEESAITNQDDIELDGVLHDLGKPSISSESLYSSKTIRHKDIALPYKYIGNIIPYVNYVYNTFTVMYNAMLRENRIRTDINMTDLGVYLDSVLAITGYSFGFESSYDELKDVNREYLSNLRETTDTTQVPGVIQKRNSGIKKVLLGGIPSVLGDTVGAIGTIDRLADRHDMKKRARSVFERQFEDVLGDLYSMDKHLDKDIYMLCLQYIYYMSCSCMTDLNRDGLIDRAIIKTLMRFKLTKEIDLSSLEINILVAYMASKLYIKYNYDLEFNSTEEELNFVLKQRQTPFFVKRHKDILDKQKIIYGLIERWMSAALHSMYINESVIYNTILKTFEAEINKLNHSVERISNEYIEKLENKNK